VSTPFTYQHNPGGFYQELLLPKLLKTTGYELLIEKPCFGDRDVAVTAINQTDSLLK
jgi:hypothetical protein